MADYYPSQKGTCERAITVFVLLLLMCHTGVVSQLKRKNPEDTKYLPDVGDEPQTIESLQGLFL